MRLLAPGGAPGENGPGEMSFLAKIHGCLEVPLFCDVRKKLRGLRLRYVILARKYHSVM
jgi:hypothetical protein